MRNIIFRGKRINRNGEWGYGDLRRFGGNTWVFPHDKDAAYDADVVDPETVGEYTGLNDRRCNPIYEGDILRVTSLQPETLGKKMNVAVEYDGGRAAFLVKNGEKFQQLGLCALENDVVIVGNIYDNPELLKQK